MVDPNSLYLYFLRLADTYVLFAIGIIVILGILVQFILFGFPVIIVVRLLLDRLDTEVLLIFGFISFGFFDLLSQIE